MLCPSLDLVAKFIGFGAITIFCGLVVVFFFHSLFHWYERFFGGGSDEK